MKHFDFGRKFNDDFDNFVRTQITPSAKDALKDKGVGGGKTGSGDKKTSPPKPQRRKATAGDF